MNKTKRLRKLLFVGALLLAAVITIRGDTAYASQGGGAQFAEKIPCFLNDRPRLDEGNWLFDSLSLPDEKCAFDEGVISDPGHPYPRTAIFQWGGAVPEWYARFDLVMTRITDLEFIAQAKTLNPDLLWLPMRDFNKAYEGVSNFPEEWLLRDSHGDPIPLYSPDTFFVDLSDLGIRISNRTVGGLPVWNQRLSEFYPQYLDDLVTKSGADGIATDGLYHRLHLQYRMWEDVDLDRNGINDLDEHGKEWVIDHWANGVDSMLSRLREHLGADKLILINTGSSDAPQKSLINGLVYEHTGGTYNWDYERSSQAQLNAEVFQPPIFLMNMNPDGSDSMVPSPSKDYFSFVRFGLVRSMLLGTYFEFEDLEAGEHYFNKYYDEFDLNLGHPTGTMQELKTGIWVRFFEHGAVIGNFNAHDVTVSAKELLALPGYAGPYYRFQGGQDPDRNNGSSFDSVSLQGHAFQSGGIEAIAGDGILLVKRPQTVISEIILDNAGAGTSPGSSPAQLQGTWQATCEGSLHYTLRCAPWVDDSYATLLTQDPNATARFSPGFGVSGDYEVFEWHGRLETGGQATHVAHTIHHAGGESIRIVDQSRHAGQWNSLGTYRFEKGSQAGVLISAREADGVVVADAIKFVFRSDSPAPTFADVPFDHWAYEYIEALYQAGTIAGCSLDPKLYCPDATMTRAESAVFVERGIHGAGYMPPDPIEEIFRDVPTETWYAKWTAALWEDGYTAGCGSDPLIYCPLQGHTRAQGCVFFLRMLNGSAYTPPEPTGIFSDVAATAWYADWVESAYRAGLISACQSEPVLKFCPQQPLDRATAAYMMFQAKGLP